MPYPEVLHAPVAISMEEIGPVAIRKKRDASLTVAMRMLTEYWLNSFFCAKENCP